MPHPTATHARATPFRTPGRTPGDVLRSLVRQPRQLILAWNWKSAVISAGARASIFFAANLSSGHRAARAAFTTELCLRLATSGFYGGLTSVFRGVEPEWQGMLAAVVLLPLTSHGLELVVHLTRGTPALVTSIAASAAFTVFSTAFSVFAMRRGALQTGAGSEPLYRDLLRMPGLVRQFVCWQVAQLRCSLLLVRRAGNR